MPLKKEFVVNRQGKDFVLYAGLLDLAHEQGLKAITTTLVQVPSELNGMMAIVHATVEVEKGLFTGLGDANPKNVTNLIAPHLLRMAETRAKARALRDAVNVGMAALEELGPDGEEHPQKTSSERASQPARAVPVSTPPRSTPNGAAWPSPAMPEPPPDDTPHPADRDWSGTASFGPAMRREPGTASAATTGDDPTAPTPAQIRMVHVLAKQKGVDIGHLTGKTRREVSQLIDELQGR